MDVTWKIEKHIQKQIEMVWPKGLAHLLVGVSGGADSICLLQLLVKLSEKNHFKVSVVHVQHGIRGDEAERDLQFVKRICKNLDIDVLIKYVDAPLFAKSEKKSMEDAARILRHKVFQEQLAISKAEAIALAHHESDQAETVLLHLLRGAASFGLVGMLPMDNGLFRPLLDIAYEDIQLCMAENHWTWCEDSTNKDMTYLRNVLRHKALPMLETVLGYSPVKPLTRFARIAKDEQKYMQEQAKRIWGLLSCNQKSGFVSFDCLQFADIPLAMQRRIVMIAWEEATGSRSGLAAVHIEAVIQLCMQQKNNKKISLPNHYTVSINENACVFCKKTTDDMPADFPVSKQGHDGLIGQWEYKVTYPVIINQTMRVNIHELSMTLCIQKLSQEEAETITSQNIQKQNRKYLILCLPSSFENTCIRNRREGDWIDPKGSPGKIKIKKWMINEKISVNQRDKIPLLCAGSHVLWIAGYRFSEQIALRFSCDPIYEMVFEENFP